MIESKIDLEVYFVTLQLWIGFEFKSEHEPIVNGKVFV